MAGRGGTLLTKRQEHEKAKADFERKQRQLQTELAEWRVKFKEVDKQRDDERRGRLRAEEQLSQSGTYLKECLAKADAERKKQRSDLEAKHADDRREWEAKLRRDDERRAREDEQRVVQERAERDQQLKQAVRDAEQRAVREYEQQFGKAYLDQEERARESAEIIRKFRDDVVEKANEHKRLVEASAAKDAQIRALKEQREYDVKQQRLAKTVEANLLRYKSLVKYLALYKFVKDHQLRKRVIGIHAGMLDLVALLIRDQNLIAGGGGGGGGGAGGGGSGDDQPLSGASGGGGIGADFSGANRQSEIEAWYAASRQLSKRFSGNKLLLALGDAQHVLAVTLREVVDQLHRSRAEMESMLERVSDLTNICMAHEHEQQRLHAKAKAERARYHTLQDAYHALDRSHHSLQKKLNQMVEYAQLHSGRTHHAAAAAAAAAAAGGGAGGLVPLHVASPDAGSAFPQGMTPTTMRVASSNPFTAASASAGGGGSGAWGSPRAMSPTRTSSTASIASPRNSTHVPAHLHFTRRTNGAGNGSGGVPSALGSPGPKSPRAPHPPAQPRPPSASADTAKEPEPQPAGAGAGTAPSAVHGRGTWFSPSKLAKAEQQQQQQQQMQADADAAAAAAAAASAASTVAEDDDPEEAEERAAAQRIAALKSWLAKAGKLKPKLWQQTLPGGGGGGAGGSHSGAAVVGNGAASHGAGAAANGQHPTAAGTTGAGAVMGGGSGLFSASPVPPPGPPRLPGQRPKSAYSPRTYPTTHGGEPAVPAKLRVTPGTMDPTDPHAATVVVAAAANPAFAFGPQIFTQQQLQQHQQPPPHQPSRPTSAAGNANAAAAHLRAVRDRELSSAYGQPIYATPHTITNRSRSRSPPHTAR